MSETIRHYSGASLTLTSVDGASKIRVDLPEAHAGCAACGPCFDPAVLRSLGKLMIDTADAVLSNRAPAPDRLINRLDPDNETAWICDGHYRGLVELVGIANTNPGKPIPPPPVLECAPAGSHVCVMCAGGATL